MEHIKYNIGSRNSAALSYLLGRLIEERTICESCTVWEILKYFKHLRLYLIVRKYYGLGCKDMGCEYNKIESF
jgi:hypothetical protein